MKKYLITFLGVIFLLPAFAYAGSYCVSFPDYGGSRWTKRDNTAGIRFRYDYERKKATAGKPVARSFEPDFFAQLVSLMSQEGQVIGKVITLIIGMELVTCALMAHDRDSVVSATSTTKALSWRMVMPK